MNAAHDAELANLMMQLVGLDLTSADGRAGSGAILREIEAKAPGSIARMQAGLALRRSGASLWPRDSRTPDQWPNPSAA